MAPARGAPMGARHGTSRAARASGTPRTLGTRPYGPQPAQAPGGGPARDARRSQAWTGPGRLGPRQAPTPPICARNSLRDRKRPSSAAWRPRVVSSAWAAQSRPGAPGAAPPRSTRGWGLGRLVCAVFGRQDARAAAFGAFPIFAGRSRSGGLTSPGVVFGVGSFGGFCFPRKTLPTGVGAGRGRDRCIARDKGYPETCRSGGLRAVLAPAEVPENWRKTKNGPLSHHRARAGAPDEQRHKKSISFRAVNARPLVLVVARWSPRQIRCLRAVGLPQVTARLPCAQLVPGSQLPAAPARGTAPSLCWGSAHRPHPQRSARAQRHERQCVPLAVAPSSTARAPARPVGPAAHASAGAQPWQHGGRKMPTAAAMRAEHWGVRGAARLRDTR